MRAAWFLSVAFVACSSYQAEEPVAAPPRDAGATDADEDDPTRFVHVSPSGRDFAEGTTDAPVATFRRALEIAATKNGATILACAGLYQENVVVKQPAVIIGNRSCNDWSIATTRARVIPAIGVPLTIADTHDVTIEDLELAATADHTQPGTSAIGAFVARSRAVSFRRTDVVAGPGIDGNDGAQTSNYTAAAVTGGDATLGAGGVGPMCTCTDGTFSKGGRGGDATLGAESGSSQPAVGAANVGTSSSGCTNGGPGASGVPASAVAGATKPIDVDANGFMTSRGANGKNGNPGQGGGGGGSKQGTPSGGGGCGGCGGGGGTGGTSGGSSIALLSFESEVLVADSTLTANAGARGGTGGSGQTGGAFADGGNGGSCSGGSGGAGASGGGGGGGAGGHSIAVAHVGTAPRVEGGTRRFGVAGTKGAGGQGGATNGAPGGDGVDGRASEIFGL